LRVLVSGNAKVVRPKPDQSLDQADLGVGGGVEARLGLAQNDLLWQRRLLSWRAILIAR